MKLFGEYVENSKAVNTVSFVYAHGKLEDMLQHDCLFTEDPFHPTEGVSVHDVVTPDDLTEHMALMFFWKDQFGMPHGLVVLPTDRTAVEYAIQCMMEKRHRL